MNITQKTDAEYNARKSYYESEEFRKLAIKLMVPDVVQYVRNIFYSIRCAAESREIIKDIINQNVQTRKRFGQYYHSASYKVGNLQLDGRDFAFRNIREWCEYIAKTNDSIAHILNIVLNLGYAPDAFFDPRDIVSSIKENKLKYLCKNNYFKSIDTARIINNASKHNLNIFPREKLSPNSLENIEYVIKVGGRSYPVSKLATYENEKKTEHAVIDILDHIFLDGLVDRKSTRKYIKYNYDVEQDGDVELATDAEFDPQYMLNVSIRTEQQDNGTYIIKEIITDIEYEPESEIELASYYTYGAPCCQITKIGIVKFDSVDVFAKGEKIGKYELKNKNQVSFLHFKKFSYIKLK